MNLIYLQYPNDDDQLPQAENHLFQETFPNFSIVCDDFFCDISLPSAKEDPRAIPNPGKQKQAK